MNLIRLAIDRPIAVVAAVLMVVMFGLVALETIPIQLAPDVNRPVITVQTVWPGAAPAEVEREIVNRQEEKMAGLEGLEKITGRAEQGRSQLTLEFSVGTNMDRALLLVSNRLDQVNGYPEEADEPTLDTAGSEDNPIAWFIVNRAEGNEQQIHEFGDFVDDVIKERIERVPGVSRVNVFGRQRARDSGHHRAPAAGPLWPDRERRGGLAAPSQRLDVGRRRGRGQASIRGPHRRRAQHAGDRAAGRVALLGGQE